MGKEMAKCEQCNKKMGLMEYKCKCEKKFCITHLHAEAHNCTYDYKSNGISQLKSTMEIGQLKDKLDSRI